MKRNMMKIRSGHHVMIVRWRIEAPEVPAGMTIRITGYVDNPEHEAFANQVFDALCESWGEEEMEE